LSNEKIKPCNVQIVLFHADNIDIKFIQLASRLTEEFSDLFDKEPQLMPQDTPKEIPRILFGSQKGGLFCGYENTNLSLNLNENFTEEELINLTQRLVKILSGNGVKIYRIGLVITFIIDITIEELHNIYIKNEKLDGIKEINLEWHKNLPYGNIELNRWVKFNINQKKLLSIDMNSKTDKNYTFETPETTGLFAYCIKNILGDINGIIEW
jgi:hypothetical protein